MDIQQMQMKSVKTDGQAFRKLVEDGVVKMVHDWTFPDAWDWFCHFFEQGVLDRPTWALGYAAPGDYYPRFDEADCPPMERRPAGEVSCFLVIKSGENKTWAVLMRSGNLMADGPDEDPARVEAIMVPYGGPVRGKFRFPRDRESYLRAVVWDAYDAEGRGRRRPRLVRDGEYVYYTPVVRFARVLARIEYRLSRNGWKYSGAVRDTLTGLYEPLQPPEERFEALEEWKGHRPWFQPGPAKGEWRPVDGNDIDPPAPCPHVWVQERSDGNYDVVAESRRIGGDVAALATTVARRVIFA